MKCLRECVREGTFHLFGGKGGRTCRKKSMRVVARGHTEREGVDGHAMRVSRQAPKTAQKKAVCPAVGKASPSHRADCVEGSVGANRPGVSFGALPGTMLKKGLRSSPKSR